jgi:hypothetical protein
MDAATTDRVLTTLLDQIDESKSGGSVKQMCEELFACRSLKLHKPRRGASLLLARQPKVVAPLDPGFAPYILAKKSYMEAVAAATNTKTLFCALEKNDNLVTRFEIPVFPSSDVRFNDSLMFAYFTIVFYICQRGGFKLWLSGPSDICAEIKKEFSADGKGCFPIDIMFQVFDRVFEVVRVPIGKLPADRQVAEKVGIKTNGCRLAFDLGKSDYKVVACIDGKVTFESEVEWDIYQSDPMYHYNIVLNKMKEAAATMPRVDAIGGSSAGIPINNECVWCDCFPNVSREDHKKTVLPIFKNWAKEFGNPPLKVINDGEVTALAGVQMLKQNAVFGISMGSNEGAGYIDRNGDLPGYMNELWMAPVDFNPDAAECFFTGEDMLGVGGMCFGQRAVEKLIDLAGLRAECPEEMLAQHKLKVVQNIMKDGPEDKKKGCIAIYETIGVYLG